MGDSARHIVYSARHNVEFSYRAVRQWSRTSLPILSPTGAAKRQILIDDLVLRPAMVAAAMIACATD